MILVRTAGHVLTKIIGDDRGGFAGRVSKVVVGLRYKLVLLCGNASSALYSTTPS